MPFCFSFFLFSLLSFFCLSFFLPAMTRREMTGLKGSTRALEKVSFASVRLPLSRIKTLVDKPEVESLPDRTIARVELLMHTLNNSLAHSTPMLFQ